MPDRIFPGPGVRAWGRAVGGCAPASGAETRPLFPRRGANPPAAQGEDPVVREGRSLPWKGKGEQFSLCPRTGESREAVRQEEGSSVGSSGRALSEVDTRVLVSQSCFPTLPFNFGFFSYLKNVF